MSKYKLGFIIGRFQPFHNQHLALLTEALSIADKVVICVGSVGQERSIKNPFTFEERVQLIKISLESDQLSRVVFEGIEDTGTDEVWFDSICEAVIDNIYEDSVQGDIVLVGHKKDDSSYYLNHFPNFEYHEFYSSSDLGATDIRDAWYKGLPTKTLPISFRCAMWLKGFSTSEDFYTLKEQYKFKDYPYKGSLNICTADALVERKGKYLFIVRGGYPCKGMLALAGGHKENNENFLGCAIRELYEETGLDLALDLVLKREGYIFDNPNRDPVMTKVSVPFLFDLISDKEPVASDDAASVVWLSEEEVHRNKDNIAFDHYEMFLHLTQ